MVMDFRVILDLIIAVLLVATIGYAVTLNSRLTALRRNRDQLSKIIAAFNEATVRAEASIPKLKRAAEEAGAGLQDRMEKAQSLRDDLAFMIERADTMANRLENSVRSARGEIRGGGDARGDARSETRGGGAQSGSGGRQPWSGPAGTGNVVGTAGLPSAGLGGGGRSSQQATLAAVSTQGDDGDDERSEAERELLRALQAMR
jgi:hypothetical protein